MQKTPRSLKAIFRRITSNQWLFRSIGIVVFILILTRINLREAITAIVTVDPVFLMLSIVFQVIALVVTTFRWQLIMRKVDIDLSYRRSFTLQLIGTAAALVTPGQIGEFVKVAYQRSYGFPVPESFLSVAMDRVYDLFALLFFGIVSLAILFGLPPAWSAIVICSCAAMIVGIGLFARHQESFSNWLARVLARISPASYKDPVRTSTERLVGRIGSFSIEFLVICGLLTVLSYGLLLFRIYFTVLSLHIQVPFWYLVMVVPLLRLVGLIPVSVSGIGTRDITAIYLLGQVGVPKESALVLSILTLVTLQLQALVGLLVWWRHPLQINPQDRASPEQVQTGREHVSASEKLMT